MNIRGWTIVLGSFELSRLWTRRFGQVAYWLRRLLGPVGIGIAAMFPWLADTHGAELKLSWQDNSSNEAGFRIERRAGIGGFQPIAAVDADATSFTDTSVVREQEYSYRICAFNALGESDYTYSSSVVVPPASIPELGALENLTIPFYQESRSVAFTVSDPRVESTSLVVTARSSNQMLVPNDSIQLSGQGGERLISIRPLPGVAGRSTITLTASNGERTFTRSFVLTVELPVLTQQGSSSESPLIGPRSYFSSATVENPVSVALLVDAAQSATLMLSGVGIPGGMALSTFSLAPGVTFASDIEGLGTVSVRATDDSAFVTIPSLKRTIAALPDAARGTASNRSGIFSAPLCNTSDGRVDIMVGQGGRAVVVVSHKGMVLAGQTNVQSDGLIAVEMPGSGSVSLLLANGGELTGTVTIGSVAYPVLGSWDGTASRSRLMNLSARSNVSAGDGMMVAGFSVSGSGSKALLVRAVGPGLSAFGVTNFLADPVIEVRRVGMDVASGALGSNDNWQLAPGVGGGAAQGAFPLQEGSLDSALFVTADLGGYTVGTTGKGAGTGVALVEIYDADDGVLSAGASLTNLSVRTRIGAGDDVAVVGFAISGDMPKHILLRAVGPELSQFGVSGALENPQLTLFETTADGSQLIAEDDDITAADSDVASAAKKSGAFVLGATSRSAALAIWLRPGVYTAVVRGGSSSVGVGLVEVYDIP